MPVERRRVKLRQNVNLFDLRVDAITDRNVDQAVFGGQRNRRLRSQLGQRIEPGSGTSAQNNRQYSFHSATFGARVVGVIGKIAPSTATFPCALCLAGS